MWRRIFVLREYLRGSLWFVPFLGTALGTFGALLLVEVDESVSAPSYLQYSSSTAGTLLSAIVGAAAALTGFVVTVTVLVVQTVIGTFSPRYMRIWYRGRLLKSTLTLLIGTLALSFALLPHVSSDFVPNYGITVAGILVVLSLVLFLLFLDQCVHRLRPVAVAALVAKEARQHFRAANGSVSSPAREELPSGSAALVVRSSTGGALQAIDIDGLARWARKNDCLLVLPHAIGDFVTTGSTLLEVHGVVHRPRLTERQLSGRIALGVERTIQQDPAFSIRIMVDIAIMALSPAVNAPTTAIQVLDHLEGVLRMIGTHKLDGWLVRRDERGRLLLVGPAPGWDQFLALGVTEVRAYGGGAIQVVKRLRALLETLREAVRPEHRPAVEYELACLEATVAAHFANSPDLRRAGFPDSQGLGGSGLFDNRTTSA
jgi:uncharacterized membrane protein